MLIDTGFNTPYCLNSLLQGMEELELDPHNTDVFITHSHFDHLGNAGNLFDMGCRILLSSEDYDFYLSEPWVRQMENSKKDGIPEELRSAMDIRHGIPSAFHPELVNEGDVLHVGGYDLECILTPGHTPGHICLYDKKAETIFTGDHVLFNITPNITYVDNGKDMLALYLESLNKIQDLKVSLALPGHRSTGDKTFRQRIDELKLHHEQRLAEAEKVAKELGPIDAYRAAGHMAWSIRAKSWDDFPNNQKWFATGETLAHLLYLADVGRLKNEMTADGLSVYGALD